MGPDVRGHGEIGSQHAYPIDHSKAPLSMIVCALWMLEGEWNNMAARKEGGGGLPYRSEIRINKLTYVRCLTPVLSKNMCPLSLLCTGAFGVLQLQKGHRATRGPPQRVCSRRVCSRRCPAPPLAPKNICPLSLLCTGAFGVLQLQKGHRATRGPPQRVCSRRVCSRRCPAPPLAPKNICPLSLLCTGAFGVLQLQKGHRATRGPPQRVCSRMV